MLFFWLLLLAHGLADFVLQSDAINSAKCQNKWQGYTRHGLGVFLCTLAAIHFYGWKGALLAGGLVTMVHLALDWLKNVGRTLYSKIMKREARPGVPGLLIDQLLHILTLFWVWRLLDKPPVDTAVTGFYAKVLAPLGQFPGAERAVVGLAVYILVAFGGAVLIRIALDQIFPSGYIADGLSTQVTAGKYIGILERILILTLTVTGNISAIGVVFAAKSIARFSELSKKQFAEYYLVGTLLSFLLALAGGIMLGRLK